MRVKIFLPLLILIATSLFSQTEEPFTVKWDNALKIESADKQFQFKMGGRIQYDVMFIHQDDSLNQHFDANNGTEFRRIRLYTSGKFFNNIEYKFQLDFAKGNAAPKDIYIRFKNCPE
jgi:phosphate-selective porin OprO/OprP